MNFAAWGLLPFLTIETAAGRELGCWFAAYLPSFRLDSGKSFEFEEDRLKVCPT
jgi:hypothetical protein